VKVTHPYKRRNTKQTSGLTKRGQRFTYDATVGGRRRRVSLGTTDLQEAQTLVNQINFGLRDGPKSGAWEELRSALPPASFSALTRDMRIAERPRLADFERRFQSHLDRRVKLGEIAESSRRLYEWCATNVFSWLIERGTQKMDEITAEMVDYYLIRRKEDILKRGGSARGLTTESTILAMIFNLAIEEGVIQTSPVKHRYRSDTDPGGSEPFLPEEIERMAANITSDNRLPFLLFRWTGLRGGDVAELTWDAIDFQSKTLKWRTRKRGKWVTVPLSVELLEALEHEQRNRPRGPTENVLPYMTRGKLYQMMIKLGKKSGVKNANPHRFRDSLASELLGKGASLFDVSVLLGDTHDVVESYYASGSAAQQTRVRGLLEK
jgi:integrase